MAFLKLWEGLLDIVFPPRAVCPLCGTQAVSREPCPACRNIMQGYLTEPVCGVCGRFRRYSPAAGSSDGSGAVSFFTCRECVAAGRHFMACRAAGPYEGMLKDAVHSLKFAGKKYLAPILAQYMVQCARRENFFKEADIVVPVPLSPGRKQKRGFNQAALLAELVAGELHLPLLEAVKKMRETPAQAGLKREDRLENLLGAFKVASPDSVKGKVMLVVDDVFTTGATLEAVSAELMGAGASAVLGLTAAGGRCNH